MSSRELPARPNLEHLKKQARHLLADRLRSDRAAAARFEALGLSPSPPKLADALHVIAREYGFPTWPALKLHIGAASDDPLQALGAAIEANDIALARQILGRPHPWPELLNQPLPHASFDTPALVLAVQKENRDLVDALLAAGADSNQRTRWWAGGFGVLDFAKGALASHLISRGTRVDIHAAARLGMLDRVRELLKTDSSLVHARGGDGQLPLHFAATVEIAGLLLDHGAAIDARDIDHESTAAQYMACFPQPAREHLPPRHQVARDLVARGAAPDILMAAALGDRALVERILNHDPDTVRITVSERHFPKTDPRSGGSIYFYGFGLTQSPHSIAQRFGHTDVFHLLMQRSAPWLRLVQAAELGDETLVNRIVQDHSSLVARLTPAAARRLIGVAVRNNTRAVELLLERGWPANATLTNGQTALHYAAWHGNAAMVQQLLAHNAPVNVTDTEHGGTPLTWAMHGSQHSWERDKGNYPAVVQTLQGAGATAAPLPEA